MLRGIKYLSKERKAYTLLVLVYHARSLLSLAFLVGLGKTRTVMTQSEVKDKEENCLGKGILTKV